jgi:4'-phosphopantetheinyl transferase
MRCPTGEVHIWRIDLDAPVLPRETLAESLSAAERERAAKFRSSQDHDRWVVAHGAMRRILAQYAGVQPAQLVFEAQEHGKPRLAQPLPEISFSLTHTAGAALLAVAGSGRVGVDAEFIRPLSDLQAIARRFFAPAEAQEIMSQDAPAQPAAFFACWTRKEAFVKALGKGLSIPLDQFTVNVRPEDAPKLLRIDWQEPSSWYLADLSEQDMAATVAVDTPITQLRRLSFASDLSQA